MKPLKTLALGALFSAAPLAHGADLSYETQVKRANLSFLTEFSTLKLNSAFLSGAGIRVNFDYALGERYGFQLGVAQTLRLQASSPEALYTGLTAGLEFSLTGSLMRSRRRLLNGSKTWVQLENAADRGALIASLGLEQLYLNGKNIVYPASGLAGGLRYEFGYGDWRVHVGMRSGVLRASDQTILPMVLTTGFLMSL